MLCMCFFLYPLFSQLNTPFPPGLFFQFNICIYTVLVIGRACYIERGMFLGKNGIGFRGHKG